MTIIAPNILWRHKIIIGAMFILIEKAMQQRCFCLLVRLKV